MFTYAPPLGACSDLYSSMIRPGAPATRTPVSATTAPRPRSAERHLPAIHHATPAIRPTEVSTAAQTRIGTRELYDTSYLAGPAYSSSAQTSTMANATAPPARAPFPPSGNRARVKH